MALHFALYARFNAGNGKFPSVKVEFSKNHLPIPVEGATYYLRPCCGNRNPIFVGKDVTAAYTALINSHNDKLPDAFVPKHSRVQASHSSTPTVRKTIEEAAAEYIDRSEQKEHKTYLGYRNATNLFVASCKKNYFDEIRRNDMLDFKYFLQTYISPRTGGLLGGSTIFNYFLKAVVFLNDLGIGKYAKDEDWLQPKDWPVNVDKRNKNKKYPVFTEQEFAAMLKVSDIFAEALIRFLVGTGFRIGEAAVAQWKDINWDNKTISVRFKPEFKFKPKDWEERTVAMSDTLTDCLKKYRGDAPDDALIFPSPMTETVDKHLDRIVNRIIEKANEAGYSVKKPKKPCHAFRVLYATRRHQQGVDTETLRQDLGHGDITTTQIYLRSTDTQSVQHRARINEADRFSKLPARKSAQRRTAMVGLRRKQTTV